MRGRRRLGVGRRGVDAGIGGIRGGADRVAGKADRIRGGGEMKSGRRCAEERLNLIPIVVSRRRRLLGESGKRVRKVEGGIKEGSREDKHRGRRRTREGERDSVRIVFLHVFP